MATTTAFGALAGSCRSFASSWPRWAPAVVEWLTGVAYVGLVGRLGSELQFTALGDAVNTAARLGSLAGAGEILVSSHAAAAAGISVEGLEVRHLALKGRAEPVDAVVIAGAGATAR